MQGMAFGAGSEVAHQAVRGVMGGGNHAQQPQQQYVRHYFDIGPATTTESASLHERNQHVDELPEHKQRYKLLPELL